MTRPNTPFLAITTAALLAGLAMPAQAAPIELVTNGSFELTTLTATTKKKTFAGNVTGWTTAANANLTFIDAPGTADDGSYLSVYKGFPATSPNGGNFVEADADSQYAAPITQTISGLAIGKSYALTFYQAAGQQDGFPGPTTERWQVSLGTNPADVRLSKQFSLLQGGTGPWEVQTMTFVANATSELLSFLAVGTPVGAPPIAFLDGVSLVQVPEPMTMTLLGIGLAGTVAVRSRAKRAG